jgi:alpha-beta hydrolase superfamily lysophospholipase
VVYLHGYSASSEEIRPVPDQVAAGLGANLFFTRLTGHGLDGSALAKATPEAWLQDTAEAMAIARRLGDKVLVIATSTGGTLAAFVAADPVLSQNVGGIVFISPNFGVTPAGAFILNLPFAEVWGPVLAGTERHWTPRNELQARFWTTSYPTAAMFPMRDLVNAAVQLDYSRMTLPALFYYSQNDRVVDPAETTKVVAKWGGPLTVEHPVMGPRDDAMSHIVAGDIISPGQTAIATDRILDWAKGL